MGNIRKRKRIKRRVSEEMAEGDVKEAILAHFLHGIALKPAKMMAYERVMMVMKLLSVVEESRIAEELQKGWENVKPINYRQARYYINLANEIFSTEEYNERARWIASLNFFDRVANAAEIAGDLQAAIKARAEADKLYAKLAKQPNGIKATDFINPEAFNFIPTTDIRYLQQNNEE